jgi:hypothetical protein
MGIALDAWVLIDDDCRMKSEVCRTEAQLELGHGTGSLHLIASEEGLARLVDVAGAALKDMRAGAELDDQTDNSVPNQLAYAEVFQAAQELTGAANDPQAGEDQHVKAVKQQIDAQ